MNRSIRVVEHDGTVYVPTIRGAVHTSPSQWAILYIPVNGRQYPYRPDRFIVVTYDGVVERRSTLEAETMERDADQWQRSVERY